MLFGAREYRVLPNPQNGFGRYLTRARIGVTGQGVCCAFRVKNPRGIDAVKEAVTRLGLTCAEEADNGPVREP